MEEKKLIIAKSITQAVKLKDKDSTFLSGGTEINRLGSLVNVNNLISIKKLFLNEISLAKLEEKDGKHHEYVKIGAGATFQSMIESEIVPDYLKTACYFMSSRTKRNMATIGGNVALLRDDSYLLPTLLASDSKLEFSTGRIINLDNYLIDNDKYKDNLIVCFYVNSKTFVSSKRYSNTAASHAVITMSVGWSRKNGFKVSLALKNSGVYVFPELAEFMDANLRSTETEFLNHFKSTKDFRIKDDMYGSADYKRYLLGITCFDLTNAVKTMREEVKK